MDYLKAKGETHLRPEMRRLILWGMASPFLAIAAGIALVAAFKFDGQANVLYLPFGCFSFVGNVVIVPWGFRAHRQLRGEPKIFVNLFRALLSLNTLYLAYTLCLLVFVFIALKND